MSISEIDDARLLWAGLLMRQKGEAAKFSAVRQMLIDALDACEQSDVEVAIQKALDAFEKASP